MLFKRRPSSLQSTPAVVALGALAVLAIAEQVWPLRRAREPKARRWARNSTLAVLGFASQSVERAIAQRLAESQAPRQRGVRASARPAAAHALLGLLAMDYTLYLWHVLTHEVRFLWRFHAVHHADRDLDVSTALRFHVAELTCSIPWRVAQVRLLGIEPRVLSWWQTALLVSVLFQHSNLRLPERWDRALSWLIVTPRLHGIHHSSKASERGSNWSSGLSLWDRIHGTFRDDRAQAEIEIGLAEAQRPSDVRFVALLLPSLLLREAEA